MRAILWVTLAVLASLVPSVSADVNVCAQPATRSFTGAVVPMLEVNGIVAFIDHSCTGSGYVGGCGPRGCMAACGQLGIYVVGTTYCGPLVAPGGMVTCSWVRTTGLFDLITVGFDADLDGNITSTEYAFTAGRMPRPDAVGTVESMTGKSVWSSFGAGAWAINNPGNTDARVIVYPTSGRQFQTIADGYIGCA